MCSSFSFSLSYSFSPSLFLFLSLSLYLSFSPPLSFILIAQFHCFFLFLQVSIRCCPETATHCLSVAPQALSTSPRVSTVTTPTPGSRVREWNTVIMGLGLAAVRVLKTKPAGYECLVLFLLCLCELYHCQSSTYLYDGISARMRT